MTKLLDSKLNRITFAVLKGSGSCPPPATELRPGSAAGDCFSTDPLFLGLRAILCFARVQMSIDHGCVEFISSVMDLW